LEWVDPALTCPDGSRARLLAYCSGKKLARLLNFRGGWHRWYAVGYGCAFFVHEFIIASATGPERMEIVRSGNWIKLRFFEIILESSIKKHAATGKRTFATLHQYIAVRTVVIDVDSTPAITAVLP